MDAEYLVLECSAGAMPAVLAEFGISKGSDCVRDSDVPGLKTVATGGLYVNEDAVQGLARRGLSLCGYLVGEDYGVRFAAWGGDYVAAPCDEDGRLLVTLDDDGEPERGGLSDAREVLRVEGDVKRAEAFTAATAAKIAAAHKTPPDRRPGLDDGKRRLRTQMLTRLRRAVDPFQPGNYPIMVGPEESHRLLVEIVEGLALLLGEED